MTAGGVSQAPAKTVSGGKIFGMPKWPKDPAKVHFRIEFVCPFALFKVVVRASCQIVSSSSLLCVIIGAIGHFSPHEDSTKQKAAQLS